MKKILIFLVILFLMPTFLCAGSLERFFEGNQRRRMELAHLQDSANPPELAMNNWMNSEPLSLSGLRGKIVVLDFWATWCMPCIRSIPHNNALAAKYANRGVVFVGVCHRRGGDRMAQVVNKMGITYPTGLDTRGATTHYYRVDTFPDYYIIDRNGVLRIADCRKDKVEEAIQALLAEQPN